MVVDATRPVEGLGSLHFHQSGEENLFIVVSTVVRFGIISMIVLLHTNFIHVPIASHFACCRDNPSCSTARRATVVGEKEPRDREQAGRYESLPVQVVGPLESKHAFIFALVSYSKVYVKDFRRQCTSINPPTKIIVR